MAHDTIIKEHDMQAYLEKHNIQAVVEEAINAAVLTNSDDPFGTIARSVAGSQAGAANGADSAKRQRSAPAPLVMPKRALGGTNLEVSALSLGCFAFGGDRQTGTHNGAAFTKLHAGVWGEQDDVETFATVKAALDAGINFFDNAEMYTCESRARISLHRAVNCAILSRLLIRLTPRVSLQVWRRIRRGGDGPRAQGVRPRARVVLRGDEGVR